MSERDDQQHVPSSADAERCRRPRGRRGPARSSTARTVANSAGSSASRSRSVVQHAAEATSARRRSWLPGVVVDQHVHRRARRASRDEHGAEVVERLRSARRAAAQAPPCERLRSRSGRGGTGRASDRSSHTSPSVANSPAPRTRRAPITTPRPRPARQRAVRAAGASAPQCVGRPGGEPVDVGHAPVWHRARRAGAADGRLVACRRTFWTSVARDVVRVAGPDASDVPPLAAVAGPPPARGRRTARGRSCSSRPARSTCCCASGERGDDEFVLDTDAGFGDVMIARLQPVQDPGEGRDRAARRGRCIAVRGDGVVAPRGRGGRRGASGVDLLGADTGAARRRRRRARADGPARARASRRRGRRWAPRSCRARRWSPRPASPIARSASPRAATPARSWSSGWTAAAQRRRECCASSTCRRVRAAVTTSCATAP